MKYLFPITTVAWSILVFIGLCELADQLAPTCYPFKDQLSALWITYIRETTSDILNFATFGYFEGQIENYFCDFVATGTLFSLYGSIVRMHTYVHLEEKIFIPVYYVLLVFFWPVLLLRFFEPPPGQLDVDLTEDELDKKAAVWNIYIPIFMTVAAILADYFGFCSG